MDRIKEIERRLNIMSSYKQKDLKMSERQEMYYDDVQYLLEENKKQSVLLDKYEAIINLDVIEENKRLREILSKAKDKSQIFTSHIAYCKDKYYHLDPEDTFNKAQGVYDLLEQALREDYK